MLWSIFSNNPRTPLSFFFSINCFARESCMYLEKWRRKKKTTNWMLFVHLGNLVSMLWDFRTKWLVWMSLKRHENMLNLFNLLKTRGGKKKIKDNQKRLAWRKWWSEHWTRSQEVFCSFIHLFVHSLMSIVYNTLGWALVGWIISPPPSDTAY